MKVHLYSYFQVVDGRREYLGERYFKVDLNSDTVMQIVFSTGDSKRGRGNTTGIYVIARMTFLANYRSMDYVEQISERVWNTQHKKIIQFVS